MRRLLFSFALLSLCVTAIGCDVLTQTGGPCTYDDYDGQWVVTDISAASDDLSLVTMAFTADAESGELPDDEPTEFAMCLDAPTIENELLEVDATWPGTLSVQTDGTCTPTVFDNYTATLQAFATACPEPERP